MTTVGEKLLAENRPDELKNVKENLEPVSETLADLIINSIYGKLWANNKVDQKMRAIITVTCLATQANCTPQLKSHIGGALNVGVTKEEIITIMEQISAYNGMPSAINGLKTAIELFEERGL